MIPFGAHTNQMLINITWVVMEMTPSTVDGWLLITASTSQDKEVKITSAQSFTT